MGGFPVDFDVELIAVGTIFKDTAVVVGRGRVSSRGVLVRQRIQFRMGEQVLRGRVQDRDLIRRVGRETGVGGVVELNQLALFGAYAPCLGAHQGRVQEFRQVSLGAASL